MNLIIMDDVIAMLWDDVIAYLDTHFPIQIIKLES